MRLTEGAVDKLSLLGILRPHEVVEDYELSASALKERVMMSLTSSSAAKRMSAQDLPSEVLLITYRSVSYTHLTLPTKRIV